VLQCPGCQIGARTQREALPRRASRA
jgi:hypothetical protein